MFLIALFPTQSLEERVLSILQNATGGAAWRYSSATFDVEPAPIGSAALKVATIHGMYCGSVDSGAIDASLARSETRSLFLAYGIELREPDPKAPWPLSYLDGLSETRRIGYKLCSQEELPRFASRDDTAGIDKNAIDWLKMQGYATYVADGRQFRCYDDEATSRLAYLFGVVAFLNEATTGESVNIEGLRYEREAQWDLQIEAIGDQLASISSHNRTYLIECPVASLVYAKCQGLESFRPSRLVFGQNAEEARALMPAESTYGSPSVLALWGTGPEESLMTRTSFAIEVRQRLGTETLSRRATGLVIFLPGCFDLLRPFEVSISVPKGRWHIGKTARIGGAVVANWSSDLLAPEKADPNAIDERENRAR